MPFMPCRLGLSGNQKSSGHHSQKSAMNYRCSMVPKISYQFLGVQKKMLRYSNWNGIFMDFFMDFHGLLHAGISAIPQKKRWEFPRVPKKSQRLGGDLLHLVVGDCRWQWMGWTCQGNTTKIPWFREEHPFFSIFSYLYIYMCPSK